MTPEERARYLIEWLDCIGTDAPLRMHEEGIAEQFRDAVRDAYEDAARIADDVTDTTRLKTNVVLLGRDIAAAIRASAKETKA